MFLNYFYFLIGTIYITFQVGADNGHDIDVIDKEHSEYSIIEVDDQSKDADESLKLLNLTYESSDKVATKVNNLEADKVDVTCIDEENKESNTTFVFSNNLNPKHHRKIHKSENNSYREEDIVNALETSAMSFTWDRNAKRHSDADIDELENAEIKSKDTDNKKCDESKNPLTASDIYRELITMFEAQKEMKSYISFSRIPFGSYIAVSMYRIYFQEKDSNIDKESQVYSEVIRQRLIYTKPAFELNTLCWKIYLISHYFYHVREQVFSSMSSTLPVKEFLPKDSLKYPHKIKHMKQYLGRILPSIHESIMTVAYYFLSVVYGLQEDGKFVAREFLRRNGVIDAMYVLKNIISLILNGIPAAWELLYVKFANLMRICTYIEYVAYYTTKNMNNRKEIRTEIVNWRDTSPDVNPDYT